MQRIQLLIPFLSVVAVLFAQSAQAHPHVWTTMRTAVMVNDANKIDAISVEWTFDEAYSGYALEGLDSNHNGTFEETEIEPLTKENIASLVESNYFIAVRQNGNAVEHGAVVKSAQTFDGAKLSLYFTLPLKQAIDPVAGPVQVKVYDPEFFIAFDYALSEPAKVEGVLPTGCAMALKPLPTTDELDKTQKYLADKSVDWKPENGEDFGAIFAQALLVECK